MTEAVTKKPTEKARLESLKLRAETDRAQAEAEAARAEARVKNAEAAVHEAQLRVHEIATLDVQRQEDRYLSGDYMNRRYLFRGGVDKSTVAQAMTILQEWSRTDAREGVDPRPIEIVFNSPGGDVISGMALYDLLRHLSNSGHHITTGTLGYAASMGGILLQAGDHRWIGAQSYLMIHEISAGTGGKVGEIIDAVKFYEMICARVVDIFVSRSKGKTKTADFKKKWERTDWWLSSDEALKHGFVDEIRGA